MISFSFRDKNSLTLPHYFFVLKIKENSKKKKKKSLIWSQRAGELSTYIFDYTIGINENYFVRKEMSVTIRLSSLTVKI